MIVGLLAVADDFQIRPGLFDEGIIDEHVREAELAPAASIPGIGSRLLGLPQIAVQFRHLPALLELDLHGVEF